MFPFRAATKAGNILLIEHVNYYKMFLRSHFSTALPKLRENFSVFYSETLLYSRISPRRFYRITLFNEALEKLIFLTVAFLIPVRLIKLHRIFNLALWASLLTWILQTPQQWVGEIQSRWTYGAEKWCILLFLAVMRSDDDTSFLNIKKNKTQTVLKIYIYTQIESKHISKSQSTNHHAVAMIHRTKLYSFTKTATWVQ